MKLLILCFLFFSTPSRAYEFNCYTECRFFKPSCQKDEKNRKLSTSSKSPSKLFTDIEIYCDVEGKALKSEDHLYRLSITDKKLNLNVVKEKKIALSEGEEVKPKLKFNNFTFSNPYKGQRIKVEFNGQSKVFYFDGVSVH